jgi:hypothetical protein
VQVKDWSQCDEKESSQAPLNSSPPSPSDQSTEGPNLASSQIPDATIKEECEARLRDATLIWEEERHNLEERIMHLCEEQIKKDITLQQNQTELQLLNESISSLRTQLQTSMLSQQTIGAEATLSKQTMTEQKQHIFRYT